MDPARAKSEIYLGRNAGRDCMDSIMHSEKSVKIVSPYLSPRYIRKLLRLHEKGVKIRLITSDRIEEKDDELNHKDLIKQECHLDETRAMVRTVLLVVSALAAIASLMLISYSLLTGLLILLASLAVGIYSYIFFRTKTYSYHPVFDLKVFDSSADMEGRRGYLIHSKVYVIDDKIACLGSMNFTKNGFVNSYESSIRIEEKGAVKKISSEVDWLFENCELVAMDIDEWGKRLYDEPRN